MQRHPLFLKGCVGQLLANVVGHLDDHADRIRHAMLLHPFHHIRGIVIQQVPTELFGLFGESLIHLQYPEDAIEDL